MSALSYLYIFTRSKKASNHTNSYQFTKSRKQIEMQFTDIKTKSIPPGQKNAHNNQTTLQPPTVLHLYFRILCGRFWRQQ